MLAASELQEIASRIRAAHADFRQIAPFSSHIPAFDLPSAYAVAELIHDERLARGALAAGRKIGFTNADMWDAYGVREPIWAHMYEHTVARLPATGGSCRLGQFVEPMIEPEIAFHFRAAPPVGADLHELAACIDWVALAFEIVRCHFPGWKFQAADAVADGALHGALLLGEPVAIEHLAPDPIAALESFSVELCRNGERVAAGRGSNVLGNPLRALSHLIAVLSKQPQHLQLQANEIVTTGTITPAKAIQPGETWHTKASGIGLPDLTVAFAA